MKRFWNSFMALAGALLMVPGVASAQEQLRQYTIDWQTVSFTGTRNSCLNPVLHSEGQAMFAVNAMPLPTYTLPLGYKQRLNGDWENRFQAKFSGALLKWGSNDFLFGVQTSGGNDYCTFAEDTVDLNSSGLQTRRLFFVTRNGQPFLGVAPLHLELREINPRLADSLAAIEDEVNRELMWLSAMAGDLQYAQQRSQQLKQLLQELKTLCERPLDSITEAELRALLDKYSTVPTSVRNRLVQVLADLQTSIEELRAEIDRIVGEFRGQMDVLDQWGLSEPPTNVDVHDPDTYEPDMDSGEVPEVEVPDVSSDDVFDENNDPYRAFAEQTLTELAKSISNGTVTDRQGFLAMVQLWRFNQRVFENGLRSRIGVSQKEWGAFLTAQQMVLNEIRTYMDADDWFLDTPVRQSTKAFVALLGEHAGYAAHAALLKNNLNLWHGTVAPGSTQDMVLDTLDGLSGGLQALDEGAAAEDPTLLGTYTRLLDGAVNVAKEAAILGISLTPVGDFIDLCELITGKELCNPNGRDLEVSERVFAGAGLVVGSGKFWKGVSMAVGSVAAVIPTGKLARIIEGIADVTLEQKQLIRDRLGDKAFERMELMKGQEILDLMNKTVKDKNIKVLAKRIDGRMMKELALLQMVKLDDALVDTIKNNGWGKLVREMGPMHGKTVTELKNELTTLGFIKNSASNASQEVWTHADGSVIRISKSTELAPYLHFKKEISNTPHQIGPAHIQAKVTDANKHMVPPEPNDAMEAQLAQWYWEKTRIDPKWLIANEYETYLAMKDVWGIATHIELLP